MSDSMELGWSMPEIKKFFQELAENKANNSITKAPVPEQGGGVKLRDVYEVPLGLPRYRLDNTRTLAQQAKYIQENDLDEDFFRNNPWSDKLQKIQHDILEGVIDKSNLREYFETNVQTEPLIVTHDGFVVSGNRRLCAFRELYHNTPDGENKYSRFETVNILILPKVDEERIEYIEDYYEQQENIKEDFNWVAKALGFRKRIKNRGYDTETLAKRSGLKKNDIDSLLSKLDVAERYLEFIGKPKDYDYILEDQYGFDRILKFKKKFSDPVKRDTFERLSFIALENKAKFSDRMYDNIKIIQQVYSDIVSDTEEEFKDDLDQIEVEQDKDLLGLGLEDEGEENKILSFIDSRENNDELFEIVYDNVVEKKLLDQEKKKKNVVLDKIKKASKELIEANNMINKKSKKEGVVEQLESVYEVADKLKAWAQND